MPRYHKLGDIPSKRHTVFKNNNGRYCREFQQTVTIGGRTAEAYGTACRQPDGSWKIVR